MAKQKYIGIYFKMTEQEKKWMDEKQALTGIRNRSAFIRKMCIDGYIIQLNLADLHKATNLLGNIANNTNQVAHRVNSGGEAYREDIADLQRRVDELYPVLRKVYEALFKVYDAMGTRE